MTTPVLTDDEIAYLIRMPDVAITLAQFNRAKAYLTADNDARQKLVQRVRMFELIERGRYGK